MNKSSTVLAVLVALAVGVFGKAAGSGLADALGAWWRDDTSSAPQAMEPIKESLERAADTLNANLRSVAVPDERYRLKSVKAGPGLQFRYDFRVTGIRAPNDQQMSALLIEERHRVCSGNLRGLLNRGVAMRYNYADETGRWLEEHVIRSVDCTPDGSSESDEARLEAVFTNDIGHRSSGAYHIDELVAAYRRNELAAASTFESGPGPRTTCIAGEAEWCRYFDVTGAVGDLRRGHDRDPVVEFLAEGGATAVNAFIANRDITQSQQLEPGGTVTLRCLVTAGVGESTAPAGLRLRRCALVRYSKLQSSPSLQSRERSNRTDESAARN